MTTIALVVVIAGQLSLVAWLVYRVVAATKGLADERVSHTATNGKLERSQFELEQTKTTLAEAQRVNTGLEEVLAQYINAAPNADLARGDVLSRLVRTAHRQAETGRVDPVGPAIVEALPRPTPAATGKPKAAEVRAAGPLDPDEVLR